MYKVLAEEVKPPGEWGQGRCFEFSHAFGTLFSHWSKINFLPLQASLTLRGGLSYSCWPKWLTWLSSLHFMVYFSPSRNHYPKMSTNELLKVSYCKIVKISPSEYMLLKKGLWQIRAPRYDDINSTSIIGDLAIKSCEILIYDLSDKPRKLLWSKGDIFPFA